MASFAAAGRTGMDGRCALLLLGVVAVVTVALPASQAERLAAQGALVAGALAVLRAPPRWLLGGLLRLLPFLLLALVSVPFLDTGAEHGGSQPAVRAGLAAARALIVFGACAAALLTSGPSELLCGAARLRLPGVFVTVIALMLRYLGLLEEEAARMIRARDSRGAPARLGARARVAGTMVGTLFIRSFERAERVSAAMQARGFTGDLPVPQPRRLSWRDVVLTAAILMFEVGLVVMP